MNSKRRKNSSDSASINNIVALQEISQNTFSLFVRDEKDILKQFQNTVNNNLFYEISDLIYAQISDPEEIAKCAEFVSNREPGGGFYRLKFWAKASQLINNSQINHSNLLRFSQLCSRIGINYTKAKNLSLQGQNIINIEETGINTNSLRQVSPKLFQYAQRQKEKAQEYLIEAISLLEKDPHISYTKIHRIWCQKNGSIKSNLDIIKPSDWWAFSHPKWRKEKDFSGSIPGEIYANALYYFAPKEGIAVDPMAGSGMLKRVYDDRGRWQKNSNFNLKIYLFDINPSRPFIQQHDSRIPLPIRADWIFIDPPYYAQSDHLFQDSLSLAENYNGYLAEMSKIINSLFESLNVGGRLCTFLPKWSGLKSENENHDIPSDISYIAISRGFKWIDTAYVSRGRQQEQGSAIKNNMAKQERRMRSDTCVLNVFEK